MPLSNGSYGLVSLTDFDKHCYVPRESFYQVWTPTDTAGDFLCWFSAASLHHGPWPEIKELIDKVHLNGCKHASYTDMQILLQ